MSNSIANNKMACPNFETDAFGCVQVYVAGCTLYNGFNNAASGLGVYFVDNHPLWVTINLLLQPTQNLAHSHCRNLSARGRNNPTALSAVLQASIEAIKLAKLEKIHLLQININNDYLVDVMTQWVQLGKAREWRNLDLDEPRNLIDIKELYSLCKESLMDVKWVGD